MKILVTGATGLVGGAVVPFLAGGGHEIARLGRSAPGAGGIRWDPDAGVLEARALEGFDGVIHLAGENIATGRWNAAKKRRIKESRVRGTRLLAETLAGLERPPRVLISASAVGFYGDRGDEELTESSPAGSGFLSEVCREWEEATKPAEAKGIRVVHARLGVALSKDGGALSKMLTPFKLGVGGIVGNGRQYMSWITLDDTAAAPGPPAGHGNRVRAGESGGAGARDQPRVHLRPGPRAAASHRVSAAPVSWPAWCSARWRMRCCWPAPGCSRPACWTRGTRFATARWKRVYATSSARGDGPGRAHVRQRIEGVRCGGLGGALRAARCFLRDRLGPDRGHRRPQRQRQVHAAAPGGRHRRAVPWDRWRYTGRPSKASTRPAGPGSAGATSGSSFNCSTCCPT